MEKRKLGTRGPEVSALGLGCMGMSYNYGIPPAKEDMVRLLHRALDLGITFFDTAEIYGPFTNEALLGEALAGHMGEVCVATKFGWALDYATGKRLPGLDSRPAHIRESVEGSLRRLGTECIDLLYQHRVDPKVPVEDVAGTVADLIAEGKVKRFGMCEPALDSLRRANAVCPVAVVQCEYSLWWRKPEEGLFDLVEEIGAGFVPYSPLGRGYLAGALDGDTVFVENDFRRKLPRFAPEAMKANHVIVDLLDGLAAARGATPAQVALAWILARRPWIVPIPATTNPAHLESNLAALDLHLGTADLAEIDERLSRLDIRGERYAPAQAQFIGR